MSNGNAHRNLLFGILAHQLDFVSRDRLLKAMQLWMEDKSQPMGQLLVEKGWLTAEQCQLLDTLVEEHIKKHDNAAEKSLANVFSNESLRDDLFNLADPQLQDSVRHITQYSPAAEDPHQTMPVSVDSVARRGTRFRILRAHAKGGLGQVSVALDEELHREVALKEIQPRFADNRDCRDRFIREAEITGQLEHPGIVPVYKLGKHPDGRPFYAMRFIRGRSLKDAINSFFGVKATRSNRNSRALEFRALLRRFVDVCNAVEYAHSRGVLHRDLKPDNVMLGKYGETLVVDWGLAKAAGKAEPHSNSEEPTLVASSNSGSQPTQLGSLVGTPGYMSPEQADDQSVEIGPPSDIYNLGATLYYLLTNQAPQAGKDLAKLLRNIKSGSFQRPRRINRAVAKPLEAICLKAMSLQLNDRYASAAELGREIESFLGDEPVSAFNDPLRYRFDRFGRRHHGVLRLLCWGGLALILLGSLVAGKQLLLIQMLTATVRQIDDPESRRLALARTQLVSDFPWNGAKLLRCGLQQRRTWSLLSDGCWEKARLPARQLIELLEDEFGADSYVTFYTINELASSFGAAGGIDEEFVLREKALSICRTSWGNTDRQTLFSLEQLAWLHERHGDVNTAIFLTEELIELEQSNLDEDRAKMGTKFSNELGNLGRRYRMADRWNDAIRAFEDALDEQTTNARRQTLKRQSLALAYFDGGRLDDAERVCRESMAALPNEEEADLMLGPVLVLLSDVLLAQGKPDETKAIIEAGIGYLNDFKSARTYSESILAVLLMNEEKYDEAERLLVNAYEQLNNRLGRRHASYGSVLHRRMLRVCERLVELHEKMDKTDEVARWRAEIEKLSTRPVRTIKGVNDQGG